MGPKDRERMKEKLEAGANSRGGTICNFAMSHFWMTVTSKGQQERGPLEEGLRSPGGTEELPSAEWQVSPSAIGIDWPVSAEVFQLAGGSKDLSDPEPAGCIQPTRHPKTAIPSETTMAIPAFMVYKVKPIPARILRFASQNPQVL